MTDNNVWLILMAAGAQDTDSCHFNPANADLGAQYLNLGLRTADVWGLGGPPFR